MPTPVFTHENAADNARKGHVARKATSGRTSYCQAVKLQQLIIRDAVSHGEITESESEEMRALARPTDLAALARAWCDLEETKRKLKMRPLPKPVDVSHKSKGKSRPTGPAFTEE